MTEIAGTPDITTALASDKCFCPEAKKYAELEVRVNTLAIPRRMRDCAGAAMSHWQAARGFRDKGSGVDRGFKAEESDHHSGDIGDRDRTPYGPLRRVEPKTCCHT